MSIDNRFYLLPNKFKAVGLVLLLAGIVFAVIRFYYGIKLSFLDLKIFAIYSSYLDSKYFKLISNNLGEELPAFFIYCGLFLTAFSREKEEKEDYIFIRLRSFKEAIMLNSLFIIIAILFFFGFGFLYMLIINLFFLLLAYIILFKIHLTKLPTL